MTNIERLAARIRSLPKGRLVTLQIIIGDDGEPVAWCVVGEIKLEGLTRTQSVLQSPAQTSG